MPNVFISYVRQNSDQVDKLAAELRRHGVTVWLDREQLVPGMRWQQAIRKAIRGGDFFLACFSAESVARTRTYQNEELVVAIEELRLRPADRIWFIPALLSPCEVPDRAIGGGETLDSIQWAVLYQDWDDGVRRILKAMEVMEGDRPDILTINKPIQLELIRILAGPFLMGDDKHPVDVAEFYIGKYPVTNAQYAVFVQAKDHRRPEHWKDGRIPAGKENHPVVYVRWDDAVAFCGWLSEMTGRKFRLPSDQEWEKAARGADGREYPWGNEPPTKKNERCNFAECGSGDTTPVDRYPKGASPYGVLDMAGNAWEWTGSLYDQSRRERVMRGVSYGYIDRYVRCAYRVSYDPDLRYYIFGFRLVCVSPPS